MLVIIAVTNDLHPKDIRRQDWIAFASKHARLLTLEAAAILDEVLGCMNDALEAIER